MRILPSRYRIAGAPTPFCLQGTPRTLATHALSIFGDHSDVMACRGTGFAMLCSDSVQQAQDLALVAHAATLHSRVPFLHFFDGFRTSHEIAKIETLADEDLRALVPEELVAAHRARALGPDRPVVRGTAANPDTFFQAREACTPFYAACPGIVRKELERFGELTGRRYGLFDYHGHPEAERVVVAMGSACETLHEYVDWALDHDERVGVLKVRLFRPFSVEDFVRALPASLRRLAVLDRCKEPGAVGDPLFLDVVSALQEARAEGLSAFLTEPEVVGGRYGLSSKEFTPAMVDAVFEELAEERPRRRFTVGIVDDVSHTSLEVDPDFDIEAPEVRRALFFGLGSDGTVGANKNSIKIIAEETGNFGQGYFVYDSKKAGAVTVSHLRFGPRPIRSAYLVQKADFVACHQAQLLERMDVLGAAGEGATFLLNTSVPPDSVWDSLPREVQAHLVDKGMAFYVIDADAVARATGMGRRINTVMQTCFFAISGVLPRAEAIAHIKAAIQKTYAKKGQSILDQNFAAVDHTLAHLVQVEVPSAATSPRSLAPPVPPEAPDFVRRVTAAMMAGKGDLLPVSAFPPDGTWPTGTAKWEKRNIALEIPRWDPALCIQCNKCAAICPHAAIRPKVYDEGRLASAPSTFQSTAYKGPEYKGWRYTLQVAPEDCTGCHLCVEVCPAKDKANPRHKAIDMTPQAPLREAERENYAFFLGLPHPDRASVKLDLKGSQFLEPLFEYSGACAGCGETPYVKLLTQLFGDRALIANATGCSSIYGGNLPTTPYAANAEGRGPAWANSLFEDNAEFGLGLRLAVDQHHEQATGLLARLGPELGEDLVDALLAAGQGTEAEIAAQRGRVAQLRRRLEGLPSAEARRLEGLADYLVKKSVWIVGGDGWAYDIGYGGLDHVLASGRNVNILVLDTEVYSNTGGQASKSTPLGAAAKFATAGKNLPKKDLGLLAMVGGGAYVAKVALGAKDAQSLRAFQEAEAYPGPSLILAYSPCIAHGYDLARGADQQRLAVETGHWPLFRFDPRRTREGLPPLQLDSGSPSRDLELYVRNEARYRMVERAHPQAFDRYLALAKRDIAQRRAIYESWAQGAPPAREE